MKGFGLKNLFIVFLFFTFICINVSCHHKRKLDVDVSDIDVNINIKRYGKTLFSLDKSNLKEELIKIQSDYKFFLNADLNDTINVFQIREYLNDPMLINLSEETFKQYPDLNNLKKDLNSAYKHYKYYFPLRREHDVFTYISGLDYEYPIKISDNNLIIALDMYLGSEFQPYSQIGLPTYMTKWMTKDLIVFDCMSELARLQLPDEDLNKTLLDKMIYHGKILYFVDAMLPEFNDSLKIKYSESQFNWAKANEVNIWSFFIENKLLYSTDNSLSKSFIINGPFTSNFSKESPSRLGYFIGWQIVKKYMDNNNDIDLKQLMEEADAQKILTKSKYKPKK
ncbi:MAG: DUF2268 domain-containing putative Zn-dependent protease [Saprospiraceae bacterium]|nr:DUF2268 domain-containing putative Zn-dependent protease [Saprospiraceae bacterium]